MGSRVMPGSPELQLIGEYLFNQKQALYVRLLRLPCDISFVLVTAMTLCPIPDTMVAGSIYSFKAHKKMIEHLAILLSLSLLLDFWGLGIGFLRNVRN
jgi:hypothetical protein